MKTKLFLFVLLFPFVLSCNKDDKEDIDDILASDEVDIEFEVVSDGEATEDSGCFFIQESETVVNYYNLKGEWIARLNTNNLYAFDSDAVGKASETFVSLPIRIKKKAKREVEVGFFSLSKALYDNVSLKIYVNGVVVPHMNVIDEYDLYDDLINNFIKLGYTREEAIALIEFIKGSTRSGYFISVPKS